MIHIFITHDTEYRFCNLDRKHKKIPVIVRLSGFSVRLKGLEPPRLSAPDPKSGAATNYATTAYSAYFECKDTLFFGTGKLIR